MPELRPKMEMYIRGVPDREVGDSSIRPPPMDMGNQEEEEYKEDEEEEHTY